MTSSDVELEQRIKEIGKQLSHPPDSVEELLTLLDTMSTQLPADLREKSKYKIRDICTRHPGLADFTKLAEIIEEGIYSVARSQSEYTRQIDLHIRDMDAIIKTPFSNNFDDSPVMMMAAYPLMSRSMLMNRIGRTAMPPCSQGDWRALVDREGFRCNIVNTIKRHLPLSGHGTLWEIAGRVEGEIFTAATCKSEYMQQITFNTRIMEAILQNPTAGFMRRYSSCGNLNDRHWQAEVFSMLKDLRLTQGADGDVGQQYSVAGQMVMMKVKEDLSPLDLMPTQGANGALGDTAMEPGDWRAQLRADLRENNKKQIMDIFMFHLSFIGDEGLQELKKKAEMIEESMYTVAGSQSEYLQHIGMRMLDLDARLTNPLSDFCVGFPVNSTLQQGQRLMSHSNNIMQGYSCLSYAWPHRMAKVAAQVVNLRIIQNMSNVQQSHLIGQQMMWRRTQNASGTVGDTTMEYGDWRALLERERISNLILDTLKRYLPSSGLDDRLKEIAQRVEEEIFTAATCESEYLHKICLNMLSLEAILQNPMADPMWSSAAFGNPRDRVWQAEVFKQVHTLKSG